MIDQEALKAAVLKAIPFREDPFHHQSDAWMSLHGIKDYFNPNREDIILEATDKELKAAIRALVKAKLVEYRGLKTGRGCYSKAGANPEVVKAWEALQV